MPRVNRATRATLTTRLMPKTEPRAAQSIFMVLFFLLTGSRGRGQTVVAAGGVAGSAGTGAGMVADRSSVMVPVGAG
ncbi:hypothetical protein SHKM778_67940 [Streptomyces sp. KM77-8]|uniref:Uncharacterized protein n=1 Tax=Streptomyces haneummycinicus TaxID=3074435 RepID=A0AAT9HS42_9ACTN